MVSMEDQLPPRPNDVPIEVWRDAVRAEKLRISISLREAGLYDKGPLADEQAGYRELQAKVGWDIIVRASTALRRFEAVTEVIHSRLAYADQRSFFFAADHDMLYHVRRQYPVGQGGLHVGGIWIRGASRTLYVYDCGSEPRRHVDREIRNLIKECGSRRLDLLFLSHFDRDHMCGIPRLLDAKSGLQVDTIVLPYVDDVERLIAYGRSGGARNAFFREMIIDPIAALLQFGPREIIQVLGDEDEPPPGTEPGFGGPEGPSSEAGERALQWKLSDADGRGPAARWTRGAQKHVYVRNPSFDIRGAGNVAGWRLKPYVGKRTPELVAKFKMVAEALLNWEPGSFGAKVEDVEVRRDLVTRHRTKMSRAYKYAFLDKNLTSMTLYSGAAEPQRAGAIQLEPELASDPIAKIAWVGTGDADLHSGPAISSFENHYSDELKYVSTFVLPHHGSLHNSDPNRLVSNADQWVAAAEPIHSDWEHPAPELRAAVLARGSFFRHVMTLKESQFTEALLVHWT